MVPAAGRSVCGCALPAVHSVPGIHHQAGVPYTGTPSGTQGFQVYLSLPWTYRRLQNQHVCGTLCILYGFVCSSTAIYIIIGIRFSTNCLIPLHILPVLLNGVLLDYVLSGDPSPDYAWDTVIINAGDPFIQVPGIFFIALMTALIYLLLPHGSSYLGSLNELFKDTIRLNTGFWGVLSLQSTQKKPLRTTDSCHRPLPLPGPAQRSTPLTQPESSDLS